MGSTILKGEVGETANMLDEKVSFCTFTFFYHRTCE